MYRYANTKIDTFKQVQRYKQIILIPKLKVNKIFCGLLLRRDERKRAFICLFYIDVV